MAKGGAGGFVIVLPILLIAVVVSIILFQFPLSPQVTVIFKVTDMPSYSIVANSTSYGLGSIYATANLPKGTIFLAPVMAPSGTYILTIAVRFGSQILSPPHNFTGIGAGFYRMQVTYGSAPGSASTPYVIQFSLYSASYSFLTSSSYLVYPT